MAREIVCPVDGRICNTPICIEDPEHPPCMDAVESIAATTIAMGRLNDRLNLNPYGVAEIPDLMDTVAESARVVAKRLGVDPNQLMYRVNEALEIPGFSITLYTSP